MLDFVLISMVKPKKDSDPVIFKPKFIVNPMTKDLMVKGSDFYAVWDEEAGLWSTSEWSVISQIDRALKNAAEEYKKTHQDRDVDVWYMWDSDSGSIDRFHKYCQKQMRDIWKPLDSEVTFGNTKTSKKDLVSKRLPYPLEQGNISAYDELMDVLYDPEERRKLEWAIGSIIAGDSKKIQKFIVLYGSAGSGKSTVLNIIQHMFTIKDDETYFCTFNAKELGSSRNDFALDAFKSNPLIAIQHDGDLSRIEDNTKLNSIVSHEIIEVNPKYGKKYAAKFNAFIFMGTNRPVKITEAKSGLIRRLIDVRPSGRKVTFTKYIDLMDKISFEYGGIAYHCLQVYKSMGMSYYDKYIPQEMIMATNVFFDFMEYNFDDFKEMGNVTLNEAWKRWRQYVDYADVKKPMSRQDVMLELQNYFDEYKEDCRVEGKHYRNLYLGFQKEKFTYKFKEKEYGEEPQSVEENWLNFEESSKSLYFDGEFYNCSAQYEVEYDGRPQPEKKWSNCKTVLKDIDPTKVHYVKVPENLIVIDFDIRDKDGKKDFEANLAAAKKWPATYAELSKSGGGIHLHYIYHGDVSELSHLYDDEIEIKVFTGGSALRRRLSKCVDIPIAVFLGVLPLREEGSKMVNDFTISSEKQLRNMIVKNLNKEYHNATKPSIDYIYDLLEKAYESGLHYDVTDMRQRIFNFALNSTNQAETCMKTVDKMKFKSEEPSEPVTDGYSDDRLVFYDVEVFPNLFLINWKYEGSPSVVRMINPTSEQVEELLKMKLVGFNCRRYDNHILWARTMGYTNYQLFTLSQKIITEGSQHMFGEAYNLSYTDVYDFCSKKQSLKKWEIELGIHHQELGLPWDQPVPESMWGKVAEYCDNDVIATEAVFNARKGDFVAREILADLAEMTVNDTTNSLTTRIIFGKERHPQSEFNYRNLAEPRDDMPYFEGYLFENGKSTYKGFEVGEGGFVWAAPGTYGRVVTFDVASMHPSSIIAENLFGPYTKNFEDILQARIAIKHKDFDKAKSMLDGKMAKYLDDPNNAKALSQALKIAINSVYGLTAAKFENPFRDIRNVDNIVAKRGALFMIDLKQAVEEMGGTVVHIKTDSIKVLNPTNDIYEFIIEMGLEYGYTFEIEHVFERFCLVNDAVYIAKLSSDDPDAPGQWTATGTQFQVPYVFKTLFSHEKIEFADLCESKSVTSGALYLDMNEDLEPVDDLEKQLEKLKKKGASEEELAGLRDEISRGHNYIFIGRVGLFCPIKKGCGGGILYREKDGKYNAAAGTKGYRWLEAEAVKNLGKEDDIDKGYYRALVNAAIGTINKHSKNGFERFVAEGPFEEDFMYIPEGSPSELPFD